MDSYESLMKGGKDGPVIVAGKPAKSLLLAARHASAGSQAVHAGRRKAAASAGRDRVDQGVDRARRIANGHHSWPGFRSAKSSRSCPLQPVGDYSALMPEIQQMAAGAGRKLMPVSASPPTDWFCLPWMRPAALTTRSLRSSRNSRPILSKQNWAARR